MKTSFTDTFILLIDTVLKEHYDKPITRKEYLTFFDFFERSMSRNDNDFDSVELNNHYQRNIWKRKKYEGKTVYKFDVIIKTLVDNNIIERTGYLTNVHSRRYSYTSSFLSCMTSTTFKMIFEDIDDNIETALRFKSDNNISQYKLLMSDRFTIDRDKCNEKLMSMYDKSDIKLKSCLLNIRRVSDIHYKNMYATLINNGRVYTSFTSLKRELREYCYIDNKPLQSLDLKSSQPYFLFNYLLKKYPNSIGVKKMLKIITDDDIYEWVIINAKEKFNINVKCRADSKKLMFTYLFKTSNKGNDLVQKLIKDIFPDVFEIIMNERVILLNKGNSFANLLQGMEADIFIPVCEEFSGLGCLSVHDSLYFVPELRGDIENKLNSVLKSKQYFNYTLKEN